MSIIDNVRRAKAQQAQNLENFKKSFKNLLTNDSIYATIDTVRRARQKGYHPRPTRVG